MPRIRSIKPSFFKSEDVSVLPFRARLTWVGLWTHCDDAGRAKDNARLIKGDVWPLDDVSLRDIEEDLAVLAAHGRIVRYEVAGARYLEIVNWRDHQKIPKPTPSRLPGPEQGTIVSPSTGQQSLKEGTAVDAYAPAEQVDSDGQHQPVDNSTESVKPQVEPDSSRATGTLPESSSSPTGILQVGREEEGKGEEGRGRAGARASRPPVGDPPSTPLTPPPPRCPKHLDTPDPPPCGACGDARRARQQWEHDQAAAHAQTLSAAARERAAATRAAIDACRLCDQHGYRDGLLCAHDPTSAERAHRGAAAASAAIRRPSKSTSRKPKKP